MSSELQQQENQEKVSVVIRGQRFESNVGILSAYCILFRSFFREAFTIINNNSNKVRSRDGWQPCYDIASNEVFTSLHQNEREDMMVSPVLIEWDESQCTWRFKYTATSLAPEDVGVIFVYIRKLFRWSNNNNISQPQLPIRWNEMSYDTQLAVSRVVCTFGVESLFEKYKYPTANPNNKDSDDKYNNNNISLREKAEEYARKMQEKSSGAVKDNNNNKEELESEAATGIIEERIGNGIHPSVNDDDLLLIPIACSRCGITGHSDNDCTR